MINTLLGAAIGLLATTAILPGSERGLVIDRSRIALERNAAFLHAIGHDPARQRLAARRAARAANDDLVAVIDRAIGEPIPLNGASLNAATRMAAAAQELWEQETELELTVSPERVTTGLRQLTDAAAAHLDHTVSVLASPERAAATVASRSSLPIEAHSQDHTTTLEQPMPHGLAESLQSVHAAAVHLGQTASRSYQD